MDRRESTYPVAERNVFTPKVPWPPRHVRHLGRLIATPRLDFPSTHTRQRPLTCTLPAVAGSRDCLRVLHPASRIAFFQFFSSRPHLENRAIPPLRVTPGLPTRNAGASPALLTLPPLGTPISASAYLPLGRAFRTAGLPRRRRGIPAGSFAFSRPATHHSPLSTDFLIYGPAIRNPRKALKT
jgi:hypothetical protein